jgi:hypothetical protein
MCRKSAAKKANVKQYGKKYRVEEKTRTAALQKTRRNENPYRGTVNSPANISNILSYPDSI